MRCSFRSLALGAGLGLWLLAGAAPAFAQAAPIDPEKQKVIDRLLAIWHPENVVVAMVQRPGVEAMQQAHAALQGRVTQEKMDKTLKDMSTDVQKFIDQATPVVAASAKRNVGPQVGPILAQNFSLDELKQLVAMFEAPVKSKFEKLVPDMERAIGEKVSADVGPQVNPKLQEMTKAVGTKLRAAASVN